MDAHLSPQLDRLVQPWLASGTFESQEEVLLAAMQALDVQQQTLGAIAEGYADFQEGRHRSYEEADADFRNQHGLPRKP